MIRHFVPVPDSLTVLIKDDVGNYFDTIASGWTSFFNITENELEPDINYRFKTSLYLIDPFGAGEHETDYRVKPTRYCPVCHNRMKINDFKPGEDYIYTCTWCDPSSD